MTLPPYTRTPVTLPDGTPVIGWSGPATPAAPRCICTGLRSQHGTDRLDRPTCFHSPVCGCTSYQAAVDPIPARFDERYDPSPEPIDRSIQ